MAEREHHTARNIALVGGGVLLAWLLLRGKGWGLGSDHSSGGAAGGSTPSSPCRVWIRGDRIELDGAPTDLRTLVTRCRERGRAEVSATGDTIVRSITEVLRALRTAGIAIAVAPNLERVAALENGR